MMPFTYNGTELPFTHSGDQVALAVDNQTNDRWNVFYKNAIASGSIIPPSGEGSRVRRTDYLVGWCVICLISCGLMGFGVAFWWKG